jgi:hypothetical protein
MASPGPTLRRHWGVRLAASLGAVLFAVTVSGVLYRIVSAEYLRDPVTGWYAWAPTWAKLVRTFGVDRGERLADVFG